MIDVLNRGIGGQEAPEELARFEPDVIGEAPALVIWQVGTNAVFHDEVYNLDDVGGCDRAGLDWLAGLATDVVLMDLQYTTAIIKPRKDSAGEGHPVADRSRRRKGAGQCLSPFRADAALVRSGRHSDR